MQLFVSEGSTDTSPTASESGSLIPAFDGELKIHLFPLAKNDILVRLENLADLFDKTNDNSVQMFDIKTYLLNLYALNNNGSSDVEVTVTERSLSNNQNYEDMIAAKTAWKTTEDPSPIVYPADQEPNAIVALQP